MSARSCNHMWYSQSCNNHCSQLSSHKFVVAGHTSQTQSFWGSSARMGCTGKDAEPDCKGSWICEVFNLNVTKSECHSGAWGSAIYKLLCGAERPIPPPSDCLGSLPGCQCRRGVAFAQVSAWPRLSKRAEYRMEFHSSYPLFRGELEGT